MTTTLPDEDVRIDAFPAGFLWGAATAAYQIEGAAAEGGRGPSIWDTFSHTAGRVRRDENGDVACDHYHRWVEDLDLISTLGLTAYRLSISWARLQPTGAGRFNPHGVEFYRRLLGGLRDRGIRPFVTLYHWDLPQPLETAGGWPARKTAERFGNFAGQVVRELGDLAEDWITLNEPWCSAFLGYGTGTHAPGRSDVTAAVASAHHLNLAHGLAVRAIRAVRQDARVGVSHIVNDVLPASGSRPDADAAARFDANSNAFFLSPLFSGDYASPVRDLYRDHGLAELVRADDLSVIGQDIDFLGVNHYHQVLVEHDDTAGHLRASSQHVEPATTSLGWSVQPDSLRNVLVRVRNDYRNLPMYVTENGAAFDDAVDADGEVHDDDRISYLASYLGAAAEAIEEGVDLRGYFAWSLMDNFEWAEGYEPRFGLIYVDYTTQQRIPKASATWYRDLIKQHARTVVGPPSGPPMQLTTAQLTTEPP